GLAAGNFAERATDAELRKLDRSVAALERACRSGDVDSIIETKGQFYRIIFEGAGNDFLPQIVRMMNARVNFLRRVSLASQERLPESIKEIRAILHAIQKRDRAAAFAAARHHVECACNAALPLIEE